MALNFLPRFYQRQLFRMFNIGRYDSNGNPVRVTLVELVGLRS